MSTDEEIPAVSNVENAKISDGASTAGEHNTDIVDEQSAVEEKNQWDDETVKETNKWDLEEIENNYSKEEEEEERNDRPVSSTATRKTKVLDTTPDQNNEDDSELPSEELTVV
ncbi:unnamed protein product [Rotaria magnacalcarata]|uniref:Uncharacterized protein n=1 Tax=Rotaria magnacalcarata TaxID=392030 RepID=A0A816DUF2_9BILA|nr:unnamed protein product [Rotaria magnacalcarata]CAF1638484.1 unnamed protein product [Rotaria magnacalcarata]CAF2068289.1 unnamed protein product [Rotaria magnacalcarata]CAF2173288.1 unnamed protein product [Rotaria magnacalcarata]CAF2185108.1 unnamed protein product [Rotaria magnacalcarata]